MPHMLADSHNSSLNSEPCPLWTPDTTTLHHTIKIALILWYILWLIARYTIYFFPGHRSSSNLDMRGFVIESGKKGNSICNTRLLAHMLHTWFSFPVDRRLFVCLSSYSSFTSNQTWHASLANLSAGRELNSTLLLPPISSPYSGEFSSTKLFSFLKAKTVHNKWKGKKQKQTWSTWLVSPIYCTPSLRPLCLNKRP